MCAIVASMGRIVLDAARWRTTADCYDALLSALGAPAWHGRNRDALRDSLTGDDINRTRLPLEIEIGGVSSLPPGCSKLVEQWVRLARETRDRGSQISITLR